MRRRPSARLLIFDRDGRLLLFRYVFRDGALAGDDYWGTPGGGLEDGETFEQAAIRELSKAEIKFENVRGVGYRRCDSVAALNGGCRRIKKVFRASKRTRHWVRCAQDAELSPAQRVTKWVMDSVLTEVARKTHGNSVKAALTDKQVSKAEDERRHLREQLGLVVGG